MAKFVERINIIYREFRVSHDYPNGRDAFSKYLRISKGQLSGWLDGGGSPDYETLKSVSEILDVNILWLIGASDERITRKEERQLTKDYMEHDVECFLAYLHSKYGKLVNSVIKKKMNIYLK